MFIAHEALEKWIADGRAEVDAELLHDKETGRRFHVVEAVRFLEELTGLPDHAKLVGKVKSIPDLGTLGGEHMADSVILNDNAYRVQQGFVGALVADVVTPVLAPVVAPTAPTVAAPAVAATAGTPSPPPEQLPNSQTLVALQKFFLNNVK
jgi:hypothetical protein